MIRLDILERVRRHTEFFGRPPTNLYLTRREYNELVEDTAGCVDRVVYPGGRITIFGLDVGFIPRGPAYVSDH